MFKCEDCGKTFTSQRGLSMHKTKCTAGNPRVAELEKLIPTIKDAVAKHHLEMELKEIKNGTKCS